MSLSAAEDKARELKEMIRVGVAHKEERKAKRAALLAPQRRGVTFEQAVEKHLSAKLDQFNNPKHRQLWRNTSEAYAIPELGSILVDDIAVQDVLRILNQDTDKELFCLNKPETASRVRGRIEAVLSYATVAGHRTGDNPARWAGTSRNFFRTQAKFRKKPANRQFRSRMYTAGWPGLVV